MMRGRWFLNSRDKGYDLTTKVGDILLANNLIIGQCKSYYTA